MSHASKPQPKRLPGLALNILICSLICIGLIALYHHFLRRTPEQIAEQAVTHVAERIERERLQEQEAAVAAAIFRSRLGEAIAASTTLRLAVTEYFLTQGQMPRSIAETGLVEPLPSLWITQADVLPEGQLHLQLDLQTGRGKVQLRLTPQIRNHSIIHWRCESPDIAEIESLGMDCHYSGAQAPAR